MVRFGSRYANKEVETDFKETSIKSSNDIIKIYKDDISKELNRIAKEFTPEAYSIDTVKDLNDIEAYIEVKELYKKVYKEFMESDVVTGLKDKEQVRQIIKAIEALESQKLEMICKLVISVFTVKMKSLVKNTCSMKEKTLERDLAEYKSKMAEVLWQLEREQSLRMEAQQILRQTQNNYAVLRNNVINTLNSI